MDPQEETGYHSYSWHQSHDQATVLLIVPYTTSEENVEITLEREHLVAGVRGQPPIVKGRLYGVVDPSTSVWQLEPRASRMPPRVRTISAASTVSSQSSYAYISEPDGLASSFASASFDGGVPTPASEWEQTHTGASSPLSSPVWSSGDEQIGFHPIRRRQHGAQSRTTSPPREAPSSFASSVDSLPSHYGRLLTLHLEKAESAIWPCLVAGPVAASVSACLPGPLGSDLTLEHKYNMDPTSLTLLGLDLYDIRKDKEESFECFVRAWHQAHVPSAAVRLVTHFVPPSSPLLSSSESTLIPDTSIPASPPDDTPARGTRDYYAHSIGSSQTLASLYLEAGLIHLEGSAPHMLLSSSSSLSLSSIRLPSAAHSPPQTLSSRPGASTGREAWARDRQNAKLCFESARALCPELDVPTLTLTDADAPSSPPDGSAPRAAGLELQMPRVDVLAASATSASQHGRRRRKHADSGSTVAAEKKVSGAPGALAKAATASVVSVRDTLEDDHGWVLYIPGLIGAGTALVAVTVIGALSFSTWRRNQN